MKKKLLASIIVCSLLISLSACGNTDTATNEQPVAVEDMSEEVPMEPDVTVTGTEYVFDSNTHSLVTNYSDGSSETADAEDCTFNDDGICIVCGGTIIIPEPVVTEYEEPVAYVVSGIVSEYSKDSVYSQSSEIGSVEEPVIITVVGTTENGWLVLDDGSFIKSDDATERTVYEEINGKIYTVTYLEEPMELFCQEHSNIRIKPENDAEVAYAKNTNDRVTVVGTCNEAEWYLLDDGNWTLKSNLGENEVVVSTAPANGSSSANNRPANYDSYPAAAREMIDNGATIDLALYYSIQDGRPCCRLYKDGYYYSIDDEGVNSIYYIEPGVGMHYTYMRNATVDAEGNIYIVFP